MEQSYPVTLKGKQVGKVVVSRKGLYYHFFCRCQLKDKTIYRLFVTAEKKRINLGIPVPVGDTFILDTKQSVKNIGEGEMGFELFPRNTDFSAAFVPVISEEPFAYISRLKDSFLVIQNGQPGITIKKMQEQ